MLKQRHAVGEVITLKAALVERSPKRKGSSDTLGNGCRSHSRIGQQPFGINQALIDLDDHALIIDQKGGRETQIPPTVEKIAIDDVVYASKLLAGQQIGVGNPLFCQKSTDLPWIRRIVQIYAQELESAAA